MRQSLFLYLIFAALCFSGCDNELPIFSDPDRYKFPLFDSVKQTRDLHYRTTKTISGKSVNLVFDFSEPYGDSVKTRPLVILMHGGGFVQGKRAWMDSLALMLPRYGYSCANISYRLYDGQDYPLSNKLFLQSMFLAREDLIAAINYFVNHASGVDRFKTDVNNIYVAGASAGAIAAFHAIPLNLNKAKDKPGLEGIKLLEQDGMNLQLPGPSVPLRGILGFAGAIIDLEWIGSNYPGVFCVHGTSDKIVPFSEGSINISDIIAPIPAFGSEKICEKALQLGIPSKLIPDEGAGHDNFFKKSEIWKEEAIKFLFSSQYNARIP